MPYLNRRRKAKGGKLVVIEPGGARWEREYKGRQAPIPLLKQVLGGEVQQIPALVSYRGQKCVCYSDRDGRTKGRPPNHEASRLCIPHLVLGNLAIEVPHSTKGEWERASL